MRKIIISSVIVGLIAFSIIKYQSFNQPPKYYRQTRFLMGSYVDVEVPNKHDAQLIFDKLEELENLLSIYKPDSEVSQLNRAGELKVSKDTLQIVESAKKFYELTDGVFDITVYPLLERWGFINKPKILTLPAQDEINALLPLIGADKIKIDSKNSIISFPVKGMKIDLGGIAVGYALDETIKLLKANGVNSAMINAGGDIYCLGKKGKRPWAVGIQNPHEMEGISKTIELVDKAVSTSGDYEKFVVINNEKYTHIVNPKTGFPVKQKMQSVTVVANEAIVADVMSTALFVVGPEKAKDLAKKAGVSRYLFE